MQKTLTKEELAARLDGIEYRNSIPRELLEAAKKNNLVIIHGASDDLVSFSGAITDEDYASDGGVIRFSRKGIPKNDCDNDECPYYAAWLRRAIATGEVCEIKVYWCGKCQYEAMDSNAYEILGKPTWCYGGENIAGKFATFDIFDTDGDEREYYCRGVVIDIDEVWAAGNYTQVVMEQGGGES